MKYGIDATPGGNDYLYLNENDAKDYTTAPFGIPVAGVIGIYISHSFEVSTVASTTLTLNYVYPADNSTVMVEVDAVGKSVTHGAGYKFAGTVHDVAGTSALVGTVTAIYTHENNA